jgi:hypothetical protein
MPGCITLDILYGKRRFRWYQAVTQFAFAVLSGKARFKTALRIILENSCFMSRCDLELSVT